MNTPEIKTSKNASKLIDIVLLRDTEQKILNYMLISNENFLYIENKLSDDDFTFLVHKVIFEGMLKFKKFFLDKDYGGLNTLGSFLDFFAKTLVIEQTLKETTTLDILSQAPSMFIENDLDLIYLLSIEKQAAIHNKKIEREVTIDTCDGNIWATYINDRIITIGTSNIAKLPVELHDNFSDTIGAVAYLDLENGENEAHMYLYEDSDEIKSFHLKKGV